MSPITCPSCGYTLPIESIVQDEMSGKVRGRCSQCEIWIPIVLPLIRKKLVYLDQSFLSDVCLWADNTESQDAVRILSKLEELKIWQKISVVVSDVHSRETSALPDQYIEKLWQFQNDLADGSIADDWDEVFVAQWRRILADQDNSNSIPVTDIGLDNPHQFQVGMRIQLTNNWRPKLHRDQARPRDIDNEAFRSIFERQLENMPNCKDVRGCLHYVRDLWRKDIRQGIAAWRQQRDLHLLTEQIVKELEAGRIPDISPLGVSVPFRRVVGEVIKGLDEEIALQRWLELLEGDSTNWSAIVRIRSAFEAELLWKWQTKTATRTSKKFHTKFGVSCQNDINHISTFVPYVDALTTDDDMRKLCEGDVVAGELKQFSCKIFSKRNYAEFESWLDALLVEPVAQNAREQFSPVSHK